MGVVAAVRGGAVDRSITALSGVLLSLPAFWVGVILVYFFWSDCGCCRLPGSSPSRPTPRHG